MVHDTSPRRRIVVQREHAGLRLDQFLAAVTGLSRRHCRRLATDGLVLRNGAVARVLSRPVELGDVTDIFSPDIDPAIERMAVPSVRVLYEDHWMIAVDKPPGMLSQPADSSVGPEQALDEVVLLQLAHDQGRRPYLRMIHRLDRNTSGIVVFVRNKNASAPLTRAWRTGLVERLYLAVVEARTQFKKTEISVPILRDPSHKWRFQAADSGRQAVTQVRAISSGSAHSVVLCRLMTGRTHQVRVHLAHIGHPVVGDCLYGARPAVDTPRTLLHAWAVALPHPEDGQRREIVAPIPDDVSELCSPMAGAPFDLWNQSLS